jgi:lysophospholipase L1-like esterase
MTLRPRRASALLALGAAAVAAALALAGCTAEDATEPVIVPTPSSVPIAADVHSLVVLGDSISVGVNACDTEGACPDVAWGTGTAADVQSLASRIGAASGSAPEVANLAQPGGRLSDAVARLDAVTAEKPDLVAVLVGSNDACAPSLDEVTSADDFAAEMTELVDGIASASPSTHILLLSVPDVEQIWNLGHDNPAAVRLWDRSPSCRSLLWGADSDAPEDVERRAGIGELVDQYNAAIADACAAQPMCVYDGGALHDIEFGRDDISSIDYFHPTARAQATIAAVAWNALAGADANGNAP